jgi:predicted ArsR family transcriptional regulator
MRHLKAAGLGDSQGSILEFLKRAGQATIPQMARALRLNIETVRGHLKALQRSELARRDGHRKRGTGRPEGIYRLTRYAESLFPRLEGEVLRELATYLVQSGQEEALRGFFELRIGSRREAALARVRPLKGTKRLEEVARIFSELGFMAEVEARGQECFVRLCHCPIRDLVDATKIPCQAESAFLAELLAAEPTMVSYIPAGASACSYRASA